MKKIPRFSASVGVMAYNEEKNIARFLDSLLNQEDFAKLINEVIIISSGSTDKTNKVIKTYIAKNKKIKLFKQAKRIGKASAVNLFIKKSKKDLLILASADLILDKKVIKRLLGPLRKKNVGITGAHPIPINDPNTLMGFASKLQWELHHEISLRAPKMGEMIAFRKIFKQIPFSSAVDEANIEPLIRGQGYTPVYVPKAVVRNKGPESISEFIARRRHIYYGHLITKFHYGYAVSTLNTSLVFFLLLKRVSFSIKPLLYIFITVLLEAYSRVLGFLDFKYQLKSHTVWEVTKSTKDLTSHKHAFSTKKSPLSLTKAYQT